MINTKARIITASGEEESRHDFGPEGIYKQLLR